MPLVWRKMINGIRGGKEETQINNTVGILCVCLCDTF